MMHRLGLEGTPCPHGILRVPESEPDMQKDQELGAGFLSLDNGTQVS